mgnify:CR=1 FL=1
MIFPEDGFCKSPNSQISKGLGELESVYAVIDNGGHQYRVTEGEVVHLQKIEGEAGQVVDFPKIIAIGAGESIETLPGNLGKAQVKGVIVDQGRDKKIVVFKKKRRKNYRRKNKRYRGCFRR